MKIKVWIDSGANIHSRRKWEIEVDKEDWDEMDEDQRDEMMLDEAFQYLSWGYEPEPE